MDSMSKDAGNLSCNESGGLDFIGLMKSLMNYCHPIYTFFFTTMSSTKNLFIIFHRFFVFYIHYNNSLFLTCTSKIITTR